MFNLSYGFLLCVQYRRQLKLIASNKYENRQQQKATFIANTPKQVFGGKPNDDIFEGDSMEKALEINEKLKQEKLKKKTIQMNGEDKKKKLVLVSTSVAGKINPKFPKKDKKLKK